MKNNRKRQSILQLILSLLIVILIVYISNFLFMRFDLTSEKRYTLSEHTKQLLKTTNDDIYIKIYLEGDDLPPGFKKLQQAVKEMLDEFRIYAQNDLDYEFINPSESADKKIRNQTYRDLYQKGINPIDLKERDDEGKVSQKIIFPGAIFIYKGREIPVNLVKNQKGTQAVNNLNNSIATLEYELTNAIRKAIVEKPPVVAFLQGHGEIPEKNMIDAANILREYYQVVVGTIDEKIGSLDAFQAVVIAGPTKKFSEKDKFVLDQYLMQGGKILWLIDGVKASMDSLKPPLNATVAIDNSIGLDDQLFKYGVRVNHDLILDLQCAPIGLTMAGASGKPQIQPFPWYYFPLVISKSNHPVTRYLNMIKTQFASTVDTVGKSPKVKKTVLLKTSQNSKSVIIPHHIAFEIINQDLKQIGFGNKALPLAVLIEGEFESIFKNRPTDKLTNGTNHQLITESKPTRMIVVGDGDIIKNDISPKGEVMPLGFDRIAQQTFAGNKEFILNAVNYLCNDAGLMNLRTRELKVRILDKNKIKDTQYIWQIVNILVPIIFIIIFGIFINLVRKRKYAKK